MSRYNLYSHIRPSKQTPVSVGLQLGDLVTMDDVQDSTGGIVYQIVEDQVPVVPHTTEKKITNNECTVYGAWDENGKKIMISALSGFVRIKPLFTFYPTYKGKSPRGKGETIIVAYNDLHRLHKVSITDLGTKYIELGELIKSMMRKGGAEV